MKILSSLLCAILLSVVALGCSSPTEDGGRRVTIERGRITWKVGDDVKNTTALGMRDPDSTLKMTTIAGAWDGQGAMFNVSMDLIDVQEGDTLMIGSDAEARIVHEGKRATATSGMIEIMNVDRNVIEAFFNFTARGENGETFEVTEGQFNVDLLF